MFPLNRFDRYLDTDFNDHHILIKEYKRLVQNYDILIQMKSRYPDKIKSICDEINHVESKLISFLHDFDVFAYKKNTYPVETPNQYKQLFQGATIVCFVGGFLYKMYMDGCEF
jgi:hypothetical protein